MGRARAGDATFLPGIQLRVVEVAGEDFALGVKRRQAMVNLTMRLLESDKIYGQLRQPKPPSN